MKRWWQLLKWLFAQHWVEKLVLSVWKSPNGLEGTCWTLLACNICSFTFLLKTYGHIFRCCPCSEAQQWPWVEPIGSKRRGRHAHLPCTFASSALQLRLPVKLQVVTVAFSMWAPVSSKACGWMEIIFTDWIWTRPLWRECCTSWLLPSSSQANALLDEIALNSPHHFRVYS